MVVWKRLLFFEAALLCLALASQAWARDPSPAELIGKYLPEKKTLKSASKSEMLSAVCSATRKNRKSGAALASAAVAGRSEFAGETVATVLRCAGTTDCDYVGAVVAAAVAARAGVAIAVSDAAMARAPNCEESIQKAANAAGKTESDAAKEDEPSALIGKSAGANEGFDPRERLIPVCDNGAQRGVRESQVADFLRTHPGSLSGRCPPTPTPSSSPTVRPAAQAKPGISAPR